MSKTEVPFFGCSPFSDTDQVPKCAAIAAAFLPVAQHEELSSAQFAAWDVNSLQDRRITVVGMNSRSWPNQQQGCLLCVEQKPSPTRLNPRARGESLCRGVSKHNSSTEVLSIPCLSLVRRKVQLLSVPISRKAGVIMFGHACGSVVPRNTSRLLARGMMACMVAAR